MPKITVHTGPSDATSDIPIDPGTGRQPLPVQRATDPVGTPETEADRVRQAADAEGSRPSRRKDRAAGTDSSASSTKPATSRSRERRSSGTSARTTANRSAPAPTASSTASSTATGQTKPAGS